MANLCDNFWFFLNKLKERLIIITEYNLRNNIELTDSDEEVLYDLFKIHDDNDLLYKLKKEIVDNVSDTQMEFNDKTADD